MFWPAELEFIAGGWFYVPLKNFVVLQCTGITRDF